MPLALAAATGVVVDRYASPWGTSVWVAVAVVSALVAGASIRWRWAGALAILAAWGALAAGWHHARWFDLAADDLARVADETPRPVWVRGVLLEVAGFQPGRAPEDDGVTRAVLALTAVHARGSWQRATGRAAITIVGNRSDLPGGAFVEAAGSLATVAGPLNPGEFDFRAYLRAQGVRLRLVVDEPGGVWESESAAPRNLAGFWLRALGAVRAWSHTRLVRRLDPTTAPLASALLLGRREGIDPDVNDAFARTGTTHLLAISGLHLQVLAAALGGLIRVLGVSRRRGFAVVAAATLAYALLVGLMPSVVRSTAMTLTYCLAGWLDRRARPANTLALAALATLGLNPAHLFDVGCQLSFLAIGAIAWGVGPVMDRLDPVPDPLTRVERRFASSERRWMRRTGLSLIQGLVLSTVVWLAALPLVAFRFHLVSPIGVLLNIPLIPMTSLALLAAGLSLGLSAIWEPLGAPAAWVCSGLLRGTDALVRWGQAQPWGHAFEPGPPWWWVLAFYLLLGLATAAALGRWPARKVWLGLAAGWTALGPPLAIWPWLGRGAGLEAEVLAVGHGLAVVLDAGAGRAVLYDCGRLRDPSVGRRIVAPALWARGLRRLDVVILSHADADHYDGLLDVLDRFPIGVVLVPPDFVANAVADNPGLTALLDALKRKGVPIRTVAEGDRWTLGPAEFSVRHPPRDWNARTAPDNARSLVLDVAADGRHAWLTGDLDGIGLTTLTASPPNAPVDLFLAPHHGGRTANPAWLYDWAAPARVVVSQRPPIAGSTDALSALEARGIPVWRTWQRGAVRLRWTPGGIEPRGFRDER